MWKNKYDYQISGMHIFPVMIEYQVVDPDMNGFSC